MCGLVGICGADALSAERVAVLLAAMAHRGPDDSGVWSEEGVVLGHRRLEIQDLSQKSHQPALCVDGRVLLYNGEIYNHADLTRLPCASDTLALCSEPPLEPHDLRGMFAMAVWDPGTRRLELTRDRFGIKPLYYTSDGDGIAFASYARSTAALADCGDLDLAAVASFLRFGSVQGPRSMFRGVREVSPGSTVEWQAGSPVTSEPFARFPERPPRRTRKQVEDVLRESVRVHTLSDVPVAVFLSAGVDSTLIAALASDAQVEVSAITLGLPGHGLDEAAEAAKTASALGIPHKVLEIADEDIDFDGFFASMDQPSIDGLNTYLVAQAAEEAGFRVTLSGLGADEMFAGYSLFRRLPALATASRILPDGARLRFLQRLGPGGKAADIVAAGADVPALHEALRALWSVDEVLALTGQRPESNGLDAGGGPVLDQLTRLELSSYTRSTLLRDADVFGMAHSVEIRTPFLDHVVLEAALGYSHWARAAPTKRLLKSMLKGRGLDHVLRRKKTGFVLPYEDWLRGPLAWRVARLADGPLSEVLAGPQGAQVLRQARELPSMRVWALVVLDEWLRRDHKPWETLPLG